MQIPQASKLADAVCASTKNVSARIEGMRLVDAYLKRLHQWGDSEWPTVAVEAPFYIQLEPKIFVVGVVDRITTEGFCEWKTHRAPKIKKDGTPYKGDTEQDWLREIKSGPQVAVYGLAGRDGTFLTSSGTKEFRASRILVRAALKSTPASFWPAKWEDGILQFTPARLDATRNALLVRAHQIRAARASGVTPWGLPGFHCFSYGRECFLIERCHKQEFVPIEPKGWSHVTDENPDPGYVVCKKMNLDPKDPELVVLSQSAYQSYSLCMEKGRVSYSGWLPGETSLEMDTGTAYHAGLGCIYGANL